MGGGNKQPGQRTKGNVKPSSSSRAAELLNQDGRREFVGFGGLTNAVGNSLGYVPLSSTSPSTASGDAEYDVDSDLRMLLRKMTKKDMTTKLKAIQEFKDVAETKDSDALVKAIVFWPKIYNNLSKEYDQRARESIQLAHSILVKKVQRNLATVLKLIAGQWMLAQFDASISVSNEARKSFSLCFPSEKKVNAIKFCRKEIFQTISENLCTLTVENIADTKVVPVEEREGQFQNAVASSLKALSYFVKTMSEETNKECMTEYQSIFDNKLFWKHGKSSSPLIRCSFYLLLSTVIDKLNEIRETHKQQISKLCFNAIDDEDANTVYYTWECALKITTMIKDWSEVVSIPKLVVPKLKSVLRQCCYGNAVIVMPNILPLIGQLCDPVVKAVPDKLALFKFLCNDFHSCLFPDKPVVIENDQSAIVTVYTEFLHFVLQFRGNDDDVTFDKNEAANLVLQHAMKMFEDLLENSQDSVVEKFFQSLFNLLKYCDVHSDLENISHFINCFWKEIKDSVLTKLRNQELLESNDGKTIRLSSRFLIHCCKVVVSESWNRNPMIKSNKEDVTLTTIQSQLLIDLIRNSSIVCLKNGFNKSHNHLKILSEILKINCNDGIAEYLINECKESQCNSGQRSLEVNGKDFYIYLVEPLLTLSRTMEKDKCPSHDIFLESAIDVIVTLLDQRPDINASDLNTIVSQINGLDEIYWLSYKISMLSCRKHFWETLRRGDVTSAIMKTFHSLFETKENKNMNRGWDLASIIFKGDENDRLVSNDCLNEFFHLAKSNSIFLDRSIFINSDSSRFLGLCATILPVLKNECAESSQEALLSLVMLSLDHFHDDIQNATSNVLKIAFNQFLALDHDNINVFLQKLSKGLTVRCLSSSSNHLSVTSLSKVLNSLLSALAALKDLKYLSQFIDSIVPNQSQMISLINSLTINNNWFEIDVIDSNITCFTDSIGSSNNIHNNEMEKAIKISGFVISMMTALLKIKTDEIVEFLSRKDLLTVLVDCMAMLKIVQSSIGLKNNKSYLVCAKENSGDLCKRLHGLELMMKNCIENDQLPLASVLDISINSYSNSKPALGCNILKDILSLTKRRKESEQFIEASVAKVTSACPCESEAVSSEIKSALKECGSPSVARLAIECLRDNVFDDCCGKSVQHVSVVLDLFVTALQTWYSLYGTGPDAPDDLSASLISFLEQILSWKESTNGAMMLTTSTLHDATNLSVSFNVSLMEFIGLLIKRCADKMKSHLWDFILCAVSGWLNTCEEATTDSISAYHSFFIGNSCGLFDTVSRFFSSLKEMPADETDSMTISSNNENPKYDVKVHDLPDDLISEWSEFFQPAMHNSIHQLFNKFCLDQAPSSNENNIGISKTNITRSVSRSLLNIPQNYLHGLIISASTDAETGADVIDPLLKIKVIDLFMKGCPLLTSKNHTLQLASYHLLSSVANQVELPEAKQDDESITQLLPSSLLNILQENTEKTHAFVDTLHLHFGDHLPKDLCSSTLSQLLSHLLTWKLALRIFNGADSKGRVNLASHLEKDCNIFKTLNYFFNILHKSKDYKSVIVIQDHEMSVADLQSIAAHVYAMALSCVPAVVRVWLNSSLDRRSAAIVESYTSAQVSPVLWKREIGALKGSSKHFNNMTIRSRPAVGEAIATYTLDEMSVELVVKMARNHPLGQMTVDSGKRLGVSNALWRQWMLQLVTFLSYQNGSILDGLALWKRNVDKKFDGVEECTVCFSVIHGSNYTLPTMRCRTCKKKFHPVCLYKWFNTSNRSRCPLCRNDFY